MTDLSAEAERVFVLGRRTIDSWRLAGRGTPRVVSLTIDRDGGVSCSAAVPGDAEAHPTNAHPCTGEPASSRRTKPTTITVADTSQWRDLHDEAKMRTT